MPDRPTKAQAAILRSVRDEGTHVCLVCGGAFDDRDMDACVAAGWLTRKRAKRGGPGEDTVRRTPAGRAALAEEGGR